MRIAPGEAQRNPGFATKMTFASCRDALNRRTQLAHCELVCPTAGVLPIITRKKRTIETVKNGARNFHELDPIRTGQSRQKQPTPPTPPGVSMKTKHLVVFLFCMLRKQRSYRHPNAGKPLFCTILRANSWVFHAVSCYVELLRAGRDLLNRCLLFHGRRLFRNRRLLLRRPLRLCRVRDRLGFR